MNTAGLARRVALWLAGLALTGAWAGDATSVQDASKPINVLLVGNSQCPTIVNNQLLEKLAASDKGGRPLKVGACVKGGASLKSHWDAGTGEGTARGMIAGGTWDFVVLQDIYFVQEPAFQPYARRVIDGVEVTARHPAIEEWERQKVRNDDSIVLELRWGGVSVLLTGDIGRAVEHDVAPLIPPARLRILKVPHHGSLTSSSVEFLAAARPNVAVVSAGRSNHFGHPAPEVLERYRAIGAAIFRTDQDGAVTVDTDGKTLDVHTFLGRSLELKD